MNFSCVEVGETKDQIEYPEDQSDYTEEEQEEKQTQFYKLANHDSAIPLII